MATRGYMHTITMIACAAWVVGIVTEMDVYGVAVDKQRNTACALKHVGSRTRSSGTFFTTKKMDKC